jgi:hypothetical protein
MFLSMLAFSFLSCEKESTGNTTGQTEATITGIDLTLTPCSGGYVVKLADGSATYQWDPKLSENMNDFGISTIPISDYPIKIKMNYETNLKICSIFSGFITVSALTIE